VGGEFSISALHGLGLVHDVLQENLDATAAGWFSKFDEASGCDGREDIVILGERTTQKGAEMPVPFGKVSVAVKFGV
jgi:hypothetical protein